MASLDDKRVLIVDLTLQQTKVEPLDPSYIIDFLGGTGLGVRLLIDHSSPGADPLEPENPLIFATSTLGGTMIPTSNKHSVVTKSPLTGVLGDSLSSGNWSIALKRTGFDALVITGQADQFTYLFIDDDIVHFRDASHLIGLGCYETEDYIRREIGDNRVRVSSIGVAGENLVSYSAIGNDYTHHAGRTGTGAVMGSKKLKAIAIRGTNPVRVSNLSSLQSRCFDLCQKAQGQATEKYRILGTPANVLNFNHLGVLPVNNFQKSSLSQIESVTGEYLREHYLEKSVACVGCPIACDHIYRIADSPYGDVQASLYYEGIYALGPLCGIECTSAVIKASLLCDIYGIDSISAGSSIAWAMECFEKGLLTEKDTGGLTLTFGNHQAMIEMLGMIAHRKGLGNLLANGVKRASTELGKGSDHWAMHSKGLELPGYDPRGLKTTALGLATATRGGCHNRSTAYDVDMSGKVDRFVGEYSRGAMAMETEDFAAILDSLILCKFLRRCFDNFHSESAELYKLVTGYDMTPESLHLAGERITNLKKVFNIGQGWIRKNDWLPPRLFQDRVPRAGFDGSVITEDELNTMIDGYYQARGWECDGTIPKNKLEELGLDNLPKEWRT
ncbi:MAG: aldehyde ferredoxin oxidoreductase family protein [Chloroflexota bacterium]|nr:aldehyde ferredoxin oxidoreductase family protein [Chloroflexota bacterium]